MKAEAVSGLGFRVQGCFTYAKSGEHPFLAAFKVCFFGAQGGRDGELVTSLSSGSNLQTGSPKP